MRYILLILIGFMFIPVSAQELKQRELKKISKLGIETVHINNYGEQFTNDFRDILRADRKRKTNKTVGIIFTSLSAISLGLGTAVFATPVESEGHGKAYRDVIGGFLIGTGAIEGGIGIPLLFVSKKRKRERDRLIEEYYTQIK
ncbi:hypothetical protein LB465_11480 [Salegentibacter sp. LM13S]|uniref:hypothetical protein n=1 Tax=Salegentibacter lacus TaxID=2873599 RepID=UPI001CCDB1E8|nr:hypothetical protein [Salegentibacter lacus]MBZ9631402.1 hypothetical protein [Salegentibacter lacus]